MMLHFLLLLLLVPTAPSGGNSLTVEVELNRPDAGGTVHIAVCKGQDAYDSEVGCVVAMGRVEGTIVRIRVNDLSEGRYAIKAFHDVNGNGELDVNWVGIPKEPYGFSNNAMGSMGPPKFEQAAFSIGRGQTTTRFRMRG